MFVKVEAIKVVFLIACTLYNPLRYLNELEIEPIITSEVLDKLVIVYY